MPGRFGPRFALEAAFLILVAVALGLADLRPAVIVAVMAGAWILVALIEFFSERIALMRPFGTSYWRAEPAEADIEHAPPPEPAPEPAPEAAKEVAVAEAPEAVPEPEPEPEPEPVLAAEEATVVVPREAEAVEAQPARGARRWFRRQRKEEPEPEPALPVPQPRHVRLLPPRGEGESDAEGEVAEVFDRAERDERAQ